MRKFIFLLLTAFILCNCSGEPFRFRRADIIPRNDFVSILTEIHIMDAITNHHTLQYKYSSNDTVHVYLGILQKYGYSQAEFDSTVARYSTRPDLYEEVYNEVLMRLNFMVDTLRHNEPKFNKEEMGIPEPE